MSFNATVFRVLIASPGDLVEEREIIEEVIYSWNATHAVDDKVVLLPVRWETHSVPELGDRPQAILNRRMVAGCDILVGAFWTRLGTPTGVSDSGTIEEIEQFLQAGKPVLLYFSSKEIDPDRVDLDQLKHLREAKSRLIQRGLVEQFVSSPDFRWKLARQLHEQVRRLLTPASVTPLLVADPEPPQPPAEERLQTAEQKSFYREYWAKFREAVLESDLSLRPPTVSSQNYVRLSVGSSDMWLNAFVSVRDSFIGVEVVLNRSEYTNVFVHLKAQQTAIEQALGNLEWKELERTLRIVLIKRRNNPADRTDWTRQHVWLIQQLHAYQRVLLERIQMLRRDDLIRRWLEDALLHPQFEWRTLARLATEVGVTEEEIERILATYFDVRISGTKNSKIVGLRSRVGEK